MSNQIEQTPDEIFVGNLPPDTLRSNQTQN